MDEHDHEVSRETGLARGGGSHVSRVRLGAPKAVDHRRETIIRSRAVTFKPIKYKLDRIVTPATGHSSDFWRWLFARVTHRTADTVAPAGGLTAAVTAPQTATHANAPRHHVNAVPTQP
eukprot:4343116-Prymnesium_polylepis.1